MPSSASALRAQTGFGVNRVAAFQCSTPPSCKMTEIFDISKLEDEGVFSLEGSEILLVSAVGVDDFPFAAARTVCKARAGKVWGQSENPQKASGSPRDPGEADVRGDCEEDVPGERAGG